MIAMGKRVAELEERWAAFCGVKHTIAVNNGTVAEMCIFAGMGLGPGDEVVTVSHSFIATANAVRYCGALPVFVDVELDTFNIDVRLVEAACSPRTKALLVVHQLGLPCHLAALVPLAQRLALPIVEDAACAIGSEIQWQDEWQRIGRPHGDVACFSFHPRKLLSTGDGGMLVTRRPELDESFRRLRQHGMSVPDTVRHASAQIVFEDYPIVGYNYRMTDIQAAIGREQIARLPDLVARRRALAARYHAALAGMPGIVTPCEPPWARTNWQSYAVRLRDADQRAVMQRMLDDGIATRRAAMNAHREAAYRAGAWRAAGLLTCSERVQDTGIVLPLFHDMTEAEQDRVVASLARAVAG
jgi:dTDP-4-amino-4,6-dideoxygalactose transaminase